MHDCRFKNLSEVLKHYTTKVFPSKIISKHLENPISLTSNQKVDLTSFLLTLTDKNFLFNKKNAFPREFYFPSIEKN
jgi:cytochrome c peroxidase